MAIPEVGRLAGHVLLDAVTGWDADAPASMNAAASDLALERLNELKVIRVTTDGGGRTTIESGHLVGPAVVLLMHAVKLASRDDFSEELVIADLRRVLDEM